MSHSANYKQTVLGEMVNIRKCQLEPFNLLSSE